METESFFEYFLNRLWRSIWSLSRIRSAKLPNVSESGRSIFSEGRGGVGVKNFRLRAAYTTGRCVMSFLFCEMPIGH